MKIARIVFGAVVVMAGIAGVVLTTQQAGGEFLAFISTPDKLVSWGPLLTAFLTALGGIALVQGILSKSASREQVEELGEKIEQGQEETQAVVARQGEAIRGEVERLAEAQREDEQAAVARHDEARVEDDRKHQELLAALDERRTGEPNLSPALLQALADKTDPDLSFEEQVTELLARSDAAQDLIARGHGDSNLDAFVSAVLKRVADLAEAGDLDGAADEAAAAFAQWQRDEGERQEASQRGGLAILDSAIKADLARGDADGVAAKEAERIRLEQPEAAQLDALRAKRGTYYETGQRMGVRLDSQIAVALARLGLDWASDAMAGAMLQNDLGNALQVLGTRGQDGALKDAVDAYTEALTVYTKEDAPAQWAATQNNLGAAGERGQDGALQDAVSAYTQALTVYTKDAAPADWAMTKFNLALTYEALADLGVEARRYLVLARDCVRGALEVYRRMEASYDIETAERLLARIEGKLAGL